MKKLIFVSTGRCGTKRIAQILRKYLPNEFSVVHQMRFSRLANLIGNLLYYISVSDKVKTEVYNMIISRYSRGSYFICSDPLSAMIIPKNLVDSDDVCIVHIVRDSGFFAESFFKLSRSRPGSFVAHNFIPLWQIGLLPVENILSQNILEKYKGIAEKKNNFFRKTYSCNPNFLQVDMPDIFKTNTLSKIIYNFFDYKMIIPEEELKIKSN